MSDHPHHRWLEQTGDEIRSDYVRLHQEGRKDPQKAGHGGEETWATLLRRWLPPSYEVVTRRYIIPEQGDDIFETDIVVLSPGYPTALRGKTDIIAGGVAAAFSVKLTLDAAGIDDALDRSTRLRSGLKPRFGNPRLELLSPYPFGLLAHSHSWTSPGSKPFEVIDKRLDDAHRVNPSTREILDLACVANVSTWVTMRMPYIAPAHVQIIPNTTEEMRSGGAAITAVVGNDPSNLINPVAAFVSSLYQRLSYADRQLTGVADGFRATNTLGMGQGFQKLWDVDAIYSVQVASLLRRGSLTQADSDWLMGLFGFQRGDA